MPTVSPIAGARNGEYVVLSAALPGRPERNIGVLLVDAANDRGWVRFRPSFEDVADPLDAEVLAFLEDDLRERMAEGGATACLRWIEDSFSNVVRVSERRAVAVDAFTRVLGRLFEEHVDAVARERFVTHLPLYSLRAAAGRLGEEMPAEEDWVPVPDGVHPEPNLFVAHVVGRSMEPRIPDGSLNLFRFHPVGTRQNKTLLIQLRGNFEGTAQYTVKKYTSRKVATGEDEWRHEQIRLEPLNPEFEAWDVDEQDFDVVAEWLRVVD